MRSRGSRPLIPAVTAPPQPSTQSGVRLLLFPWWRGARSPPELKDHLYKLISECPCR